MTSDTKLIIVPNKKENVCDTFRFGGTCSQPEARSRWCHIWGMLYLGA